MNRFSFLMLLVFTGLCLHSYNQSLPDSIQSDISKLNLREQTEYFIHSANELKTVNGDQSLFYANRALEKAKMLESEELIAESILAKMNAYEVLAEYDSIITLSLEMLKLEDQITDQLFFQSQEILASAYKFNDDYATAREIIQDVLDFYEKDGDSIAVYRAAKIEAQIYRNQGDYPAAINSSLRAFKIAEMEKDTARLMILCANIGAIYISMQDFKSAKSYLMQGLNISKNYENTISYKTLAANLGSFYTRMHVFDSAEYYQLKGLESSKKMNKRDDIAGTYLNLGNLYCRQYDFEKGKPYFDLSLKLFKELDMEANIARVYDSYSVMYAIQKQYDSSLYYANKSYELAKKIGNNEKIRSALYRLAAGYDKKGDCENSLKYAKKYIFIMDTIIGDEIQKKIADYEAKYETAKKERDIIQLKSEQKAQKDKELILWIIFLSISIILIIVVVAIMQKRRKDKVIYQQEQLVYKKEKALADSELEKSKLQEQELKKEIQYKSKQLTTHALNMMQKNKLMQEIQDELVVLGKSAKSENKAAFSRLKMLIKRNLRSEKDWDLFKLYFEDVNKNFYDELNKLSSDLTSNDLKLCALLKLNMNIKESASVLNIEPASVKTARYKLRKKLGLKPEDELIEFIRKIG